MRLLAPLLAIAAVAAIVVIVIAAGGGDDGSGGAGSSRQAASQSGDKGSGPGQAQADAGTEDASSAAADSGTTDAGGSLPPVTDPDPDRGFALNEQGKNQLDAGDYDGAVATLEQAVASYPEDSTELDYGYALFNYAQALRLSGDPEAAIPVLKKRLTIDDQIPTVEAELAAAREAAAGG